ncbi:MAG: hypothetical protein COA85_12175 [Robiginitomaculum sp.]|nr:MAG: hypothetical protein COA85_12175 [Robiginitomaculum sp.]
MHRVKKYLLAGVGATVILAGVAHAQGLLGAVSPSSRSIQIGNSATAFATIINTNASAAINCTISPAAGEPLSAFSFQATDSTTNLPIGLADTGIDIAAGGSQTFTISLTPSGPLNAENINLVFGCDGLDPAPVFDGVNTLLLSASNDPVADVITIAATRTSDGIIDIAGENRFAAFAIAAVNIGAGDTFTVTAQSTNVGAPVTASLCETDSATGACLASPSNSVSSTLTNGATGTYGVFILRNGPLAFDPAGNRVRLRFTGSGALVSGQTGVAARGIGTDVIIGQLIKTATGFEVNGTSFTNGASSFTRVVRAGARSDESALISGTQVRILGTKANEAADSVSVDGEVVKGPITILNADSFEVAGQPVVTDQNTIFSNRTFSTMVVADFVEVSGVIDASGTIHATRIEYISGGLADAGKIEVSGTISGIDTVAKTFSINNLVVDYSGAVLDDSLPGSTPANGQFVQVQSSQSLNSNILIASRVETGTSGGGDANDEVEAGLEAEIKGFITAFVSSADFTVNGQSVNAGSQTVFRGGSIANLALNIRIEVEGTVDAAGVLQADKITFRAADEVELKGPVESINLADNSVTVLGITVSVKSSADVQDDRDNAAAFDLSAVNTGDWLKIDGGIRGDTLNADKVRRITALVEVSLQGPVASFSTAAGTLEILGDMIATTASTVFEVNDDIVTDQAGFFTALEAGSFTILAEAKGSFNAGTLTASKLTLESED